MNYLENIKFNDDGSIRIESLEDAVSVNRLLDACDAALKGYRDMAIAQVKTEGNMSNTPKGVTFKVATMNYSVTVSEYVKQGAVNTKALYAAFGITEADVEKYRKAPTTTVAVRYN